MEKFLSLRGVNSRSTIALKKKINSAVASDVVITYNSSLLVMYHIRLLLNKLSTQTVQLTLQNHGTLFDLYRKY